MSELTSSTKQAYNDVLIDLVESEITDYLSLQEGYLTYTEQLLSANELSALMPKHVQTGWFMYNDAFLLQPKHEVTRLLEGEWSDSDSSFRVRYMSDNQFYVTQYIQSGEQNAIFRDVQVKGRSPIHTLTYRLWWQVLADGETRSFGQQLIGMEQ